MSDKDPLYYQAIGATIATIIVLFLASSSIPQLVAIVLNAIFWLAYWNKCLR